MLFSYCLLVLLFSYLVKTQSLSDEIDSLPSCSDSCLDTGTFSLGCDAGDYSCFCADESGSATQNSIVSSATSCIQDSCSLIDASTTLKIVGQICVLENAPTSSTISSSKTSSASSTSTTSSRSSTVSNSAISSVVVASTSVTMTPTLIASAATSTPALSNDSSHKSLRDVAKAMIIVAVVVLCLISTVSAIFLCKRRARKQNSSELGKFRTLDEEEGVAKSPVELQGNDTQLFKWGGIGVRKSFRVHTQRISSYISPLSPNNRSRGEYWGEPRGLSSTIDENLRGVAQSSEPVGGVDTSTVRWPSTSTANSPISPEMIEPQGALFPPNRFRTKSKRESLPSTLPALNLPSITFPASSRPNIPRHSLPDIQPTPEVPVKTIAPLDGPSSDFPHHLPPSPRTVGMSYGGLARSLLVNESHPQARSISHLSRHSIPSIPNTPRTPTTTHDLAFPTSPPLQSPSTQSVNTFGARYSTCSQASISTFQTLPISPRDITDIPPLPNIPSAYPMSTYSYINPSSSHHKRLTSSSTTSQTGRYYHSKQTSLSKIKPKMIYISNTPGIEIMPSDSIFSSPTPILRDPPTNTPFIASTTSPSSSHTTPPFSSSASSTPGNPHLPAISIKPVLDRFDTVSSCGSQSSRGQPPSKLKPVIEGTLEEGQEKARFRERQQERRARRRERNEQGLGSADLGERVTSWYDATG